MLFIQCLKLALVGGLLWWLVDSGKLDFSELRILVQEPVIFAANLALWAGCYVGLGTLRWNLLLRGVGIRVPFWRMLCLQMIGFFFNTAMPGAVGGDIVKAVYVIREQQDQRKTPAMLTVLLDRVIGLSALFVIAGLAIASNAGFFEAQPALWPLVGMIGAGLVGLFGGFALVMYPFAEGRDPIARLLDRSWPGFAFLARIYEALRCYRHNLGVILGAGAISCVIQTCSIAYSLLITHRLTHQYPSLGVFGTIVPIGTMTTALPLAPGGLGVGHVAFDRLFGLVGLHSGANVFNVTVLGQLVLNLVGVVPYLMYRTKLNPVAEPSTSSG